MKSSYSPLGIAGILSESVKIPTRNGKLFFTVTFFSLLTLALLSMSNKLALLPISTDMASKSALLPTEDPTTPEFARTLAGIQKDIRIFFSLEAGFILALSVVTLFVLTSTVYLSAVTFAGKNMATKQLFAHILKFKTWKRPLLTGFYVLLISIAYFFLLFVLIGIFALVIKSRVALIAFVSLVALLGGVFYLYLGAVWTVALVISILEENRYGVAAISKSGEIINGRKVQAFVLMMVLTILACAIYLPYSFIDKNVEQQVTVVSVTVGTLVMCLIYLLKLYGYVVFTVFYFACKESHGEKVVLEEGAEYSLIPATSSV